LEFSIIKLNFKLSSSDARVVRKVDLELFYKNPKIDVRLIESDNRDSYQLVVRGSFETIDRNFKTKDELLKGLKKIVNKVKQVECSQCNKSMEDYRPFNQLDEVDHEIELSKIGSSRIKNSTRSRYD